MTSLPQMAAGNYPDKYLILCYVRDGHLLQTDIIVRVIHRYAHRAALS